MSLTRRQLTGKNISTGFSGISDDTWKALQKDKQRRKFKKFFINLLKKIKWIK